MTINRYKKAVEWIAYNDNDGENESEEELSHYITVLLIANTFKKSPAVVAYDVYRLRNPVLMVRCAGDHDPYSDNCIICAPYWKIYPICPYDHAKLIQLKTQYKCPDCKRHYKR